MSLVARARTSPTSEFMFQDCEILVRMHLTRLRSSLHANLEESGSDTARACSSYQPMAARTGSACCRARQIFRIKTCPRAAVTSIHSPSPEQASTTTKQRFTAQYPGRLRAFAAPTHRRNLARESGPPWRHIKRHRRPSALGTPVGGTPTSTRKGDLASSGLD